MKTPPGVLMADDPTTRLMGTRGSRYIRNISNPLSRQGSNIQGDEVLPMLIRLI